MKRRLASLILVLIIPVLCFAQIKTTISEIASNPDKFHGKVVEVEGKVMFVKFKTSKRGNPYTVFELTDGKNYVSVFSFGTLPVKEGDKVRVIGTYQKVKYVGRYVFYNEIDATNGRVEKK